ncbi:hypothetical protein T484DRAFT_1757785, partial [Baffinella frigidus]
SQASGRGERGGVKPTGKGFVHGEQKGLGSIERPGGAMERHGRKGRGRSATEPLQEQEDEAAAELLRSAAPKSPPPAAGAAASFDARSPSPPRQGKHRAKDSTPGSGRATKPGKVSEAEAAGARARELGRDAPSVSNPVSRKIGFGDAPASPAPVAPAPGDAVVAQDPLSMPWSMGRVDVEVLLRFPATPTGKTGKAVTQKALLDLVWQLGAEVNMQEDQLVGRTGPPYANTVKSILSTSLWTLFASGGGHTLLAGRDDASFAAARLKPLSLVVARDEPPSFPALDNEERLRLLPLSSEAGHLDALHHLVDWVRLRRCLIVASLERAAGRMAPTFTGICGGWVSVHSTAILLGKKIRLSYDSPAELFSAFEDAPSLPSLREHLSPGELAKVQAVCLAGTPPGYASALVDALLGSVRPWAMFQLTPRQLLAALPADVQGLPGVYASLVEKLPVLRDSQMIGMFRGAAAGDIPLHLTPRLLYPHPQTPNPTPQAPNSQP